MIQGLTQCEILVFGTFCEWRHLCQIFMRNCIKMSDHIQTNAMISLCLCFICLLIWSWLISYCQALIASNIFWVCYGILTWPCILEPTFTPSDFVFLKHLFMYFVVLLKIELIEITQWLIFVFSIRYICQWLRDVKA